ncbi:N-acetylglucosamine kinase [Paenibacillus endoradicis]|uniref:N-acetylglucosamine kinase n=1 Tax=Paenibacillus endoradicis TaxID=2972487 RepID=UPI002158D677|nr:BadF/BadG/BcrA/BcrD ATPase family protein [Paenibacillus endoradicis]MCR8660214.1 ATPase [Paenibacillus endoradicis]
MRIVMGVDGGGSKTYTVIVNEEGDLLGEGLSQSGNYEIVGLSQAMVNIKESMDLALQEANLKEANIDFVQYGLAGADRPQDFVMLSRELSKFSYVAWDLVNDAMEGLRIGSTDYTGVVLICGSGTNAIGRNEVGEIVQIGGLGEMFGDRAGGKYLAATTFSLAFRAWEGREIATSLTSKIPEFFGLQTMLEVRDHILDAELEYIPEQITVVLHEAASEGDMLSRVLLEQTGKELGLAALAVLDKLRSAIDEAIPIVLIGSVLQKGRSPYLLMYLKKTIQKKYKEAQLFIPEMVPVYGAVMLAMDQLSIPLAPSLSEKFIQYGGYSK